MAALTSASFCLICFLICSSEAQTNIEADLGQNNVILPCKVPNKNIRAVEWIRSDLDPEYVLLFRNGRIDPDNQHPSYQNRVDLQDKEMKNGNVSLILNNVTKNDTGKYKCLVAQGGTNRRKRSGPELISIINLKIHPSGEKDGITGDAGNKIGGDIIRGHPGAVVGVMLPLLVLASLGFLMYKRHMKKNPNLPVPPDEATAEQIL